MSFGIVISCYKGDYIFVKACCASVRYFLGSVPICLIVDGSLSTKQLEKHYGVQTIYKQDLVNEELRKNSFGYGLTKMIALWESPFERFLFLDADTVIWGNLLERIDVNGADFIANSPHEENTISKIRQQYYDVDLIRSKLPEFEPLGRPHFNTGVFVARRGALSLERYMELLQLRYSVPGLFHPSEQGILNVLVFEAADAGEISFSSAPLQEILKFYDHQAQDREFFAEDGTPKTTLTPRVLHWAARKPMRTEAVAYTRPMDFFRKRHLSTTGIQSDWMHAMLMDTEEYILKFKERWKTAPTSIPASLMKKLCKTTTSTKN